MATRRIHWLAPSTVVLALAAGVLFAVGHHLFYWSLEGTPVPDNDYSIFGMNVSRQQVNIGAGTAFAFLVNFALASALASSYAQAFWRTMSRTETTLESLDTTYSAVADLSQLLKVHVWWRYPLLFCLAVIAWLLPIASIITPSTLSVGIMPISPPLTRQQQVPNVNFASLNYVNSMPRTSQDESSENNSRFLYDGPSRMVQQIANEAAAAGSVLPITAPYPNATWELEFSGPGLTCAEVPQSVQAQIQDRLIANLYGPHACVARGYFGWVGNNIGVTNNVSISFGNSTSGGLAINFVVLPNMMEVDPSINDAIQYLYACDSQPDTARLFAGSHMMQCQLQDHTYHVNFSYENGQQSINTTAEVSNPDPIHAVDSVRGWAYAYPEYTTGGIDCTVLSGGVDHSDACSVDETLLRTLSYQAIFDAFQTLVVGTASRVNPAAGPTIDTNVNNTALLDTPDLQFLRTSETPSGLSFQPLQGYLAASNRSIFDGLVNSEYARTFGALPETIEKLFRNVTVSMMSSRVLQPNLTSAFAPQAATVTLHNFHNVYVYSMTKLWIAYGLSILFTVIATAIGLWGLIENKASYRDNFSTVFRVARGAAVGVTMDQDDLTGEDPMPQHIAKASVRLHPAGLPTEKTIPKALPRDSVAN